MAATTTDQLPEPPAPAKTAKKDGPVKGLLREAGELTTFSGQSLAATPTSVNYISEALRHASMMLRGTLPLMFAMHLFQGAVVANFAFNLLRNIGAADYFGLITGYVTPRQVATTMFGYVIASKICCGITAELGAMKIQQEVDALESTGVDPRRYLVGTRILAIIMFVPAGVITALVAEIIGDYLITVTLLHGVSGNTLMSLHWSVQTIADQVFVFVTCGTMAVACGLVSCFYGLRTTGGPAAVGSSVARAIVVNLVILHVIAAFFAVVVYGPDTHLPIGG